MHVLFSEYTEKTNDWSGTCRKENDIGTSNTSKCRRLHERSLYYYHCRREKLCITIISKLSHNSLHFVLLKNIQNTKYNVNRWEKARTGNNNKKYQPEPVVIAISPGYA